MFKRILISLVVVSIGMTMFTPGCTTAEAQVEKLTIHHSSNHDEGHFDCDVSTMDNAVSMSPIRHQNTTSKALLLPNSFASVVNAARDLPTYRLSENNAVVSSSTSYIVSLSTILIRI